MTAKLGRPLKPSHRNGQCVSLYTCATHLHHDLLVQLRRQLEEERLARPQLDACKAATNSTAETSLLVDTLSPHRATIATTHPPILHPTQAHTLPTHQGSAAPSRGSRRSCTRHAPTARFEGTPSGRFHPQSSQTGAGCDSPPNPT